jgi:response regulator RpfG family c-di-GMP phosphodiesterase
LNTSESYLNAAGKPGQALIIDQDRDVRKTIKKALNKSGYRCIEECTSASGLQSIQTNQLDLIFLEYSINGGLTPALMSEIGQRCSRPAYVLTGNDTEVSTIISCIETGAHDYIIKPFNSADVLACANRALGKKRLEQEIYEYQRQTQDVFEDQRDQFRRMFLSSVESLVCDLESNDKYTNGHSRRVTRYAVTIGRELGLTEAELDDLRWASILHDVGKVALNPSFQNKPGPITPDEYRYIMTHALIGVGIIQPLANQAMTDIITHHHDHFDGGGLDQKVVGENIPLGARILALTDSLDAMTSERPFRRAFSIDNAITEIIRCSGSQFDPAIVKAFLHTCKHLFT